MIDLPITGLSNDKTNISDLSNDRESDLPNCLHENENNRKSYPQRNNRSKLNYRDLERGMYEEIRQSTWVFGGPPLMNRNNRRFRDDGEHEIIDLSMDDDDDDEQPTNEADQTHRRLWCICQKPWDHSRLMLRCDSCANWYHGDCIGISAEEAKAFDPDGDHFICPSCQGLSYSTTKRAKSSDESIPIKRKRSNEKSSIRRNGILSKSVSYDESTKKPKPTVCFEHNSPAEEQTHCIVHDCDNWAKCDWVYCSSTCIRRHINETLQAIQRSKGMDGVDIPTNDDIVLYERKSKTILGKDLAPKIENLSTWINQHPSYQLTKPRTRQSSELAQSFHRPTKSKPLSTSTAGNQSTNVKPVANKKTPTPMRKLTTKTIPNINTAADIRSKVPTALYDKIALRLEKAGEQPLMRDEIRTRVNQIEEEMYRVHGKVDNSYKNKFRSLLANISNMNNNFFYKQILSTELTAQQIVAMKPEDMLPPEEKEKRKDQFEKEIQMIINSEEQIAVEMARRMRTKVTKQGLVDNDAHYSSVYNAKEQNLTREETQPSLKRNTEISSTTNKVTNQTENLHLPSSSKKIYSSESSKTTIVEESNPLISAVDSDNDYIEPESPTGIDALIYDEEDNEDDDSNNLNTLSRPSTTHSPVEHIEDIPPYQAVIRDDYNPAKAKNEATTIPPSTSVVNQWRGVIHPPDTKLPCESVHIFGENDRLISHIPEQLLILGRLRLADLWDYIRDSLPVRDVVILTLISSTLTSNDNETFVKYVDSMQKSGRAAVISKCPNSSVIRDMYILAADTKECPPSVLASLFLPITFESKQLFLVIIGSVKRMIQSVNRSNEKSSSNNLIHTSIVLQESTVTRDPRLMKNKDPRLNQNHRMNEHIVLPTPQILQTKQTAVEYTNEGLLKFISDSLQRIRHSSTADTIRSIILSTTEILKAHKHDDLIARFHENLRIVLTEWQAVHGNISIAIPTTVVGDNLVEENMDVDDEQDDKQKKLTPTNVDGVLTKSNEVISHRKPRRKSRFSDVLPIDLDRLTKSKSSIPVERVFLKTKESKSATESTVQRRNYPRIASPELIDKHIHSSINSKLRPMVHSIERCPPAIDPKHALPSNLVRLALSKDRYRRHGSSTNNRDLYESSSKSSADSVEQVPTCGNRGSSFSTDNWTKQLLSTNSTRSTATFDPFVQKETRSRLSSSANEWRSRNSSTNHHYMTHYHDFDQPQE